MGSHVYLCTQEFQDEDPPFTYPMAHKKAGGSSRNGRDSQGQRLGVKKYGGEFASIGNILVRQRGTVIRPGLNVKMGSDDTLFATAHGFISFTEKLVKRYTGAFKKVKFVNVIPKQS